jgi:hypothetical protein
MSKTALNVIAISIFTLTLTSLLGPLFNLSPAVPAIAVAGILGLGTLDTLSWQGQGATLFLDWLAGFSAEHRARIIRHEAGHFLVAYLSNIPITGYALSAWEALKQGQPGQGGVSFDCQELEAELQQNILSVQLLDRYCTVWMAGAVAETLVYGNAEGGADDRQKFRTIWAQLRRSATEGEQKERWSALKAKTLLQEHWSAYEALVKALEQRAAVADCIQIIEQQISKA